MLKELQDCGHEIGLRGHRHVNARFFLENKSIEDYIEDEIMPAMNVFENYNITVKSFAYPNGANVSDLDVELSNIFPVLRNTTYASSIRRLPALNDAFYK